MKSDFEFFYVNVAWINKHSIAALERANTSIPVELDHLGQLYISTETFRNYYPRLAFKYLDPVSNDTSTPYFKLNNNAIEKLVAVKDQNSGEIWWIQQGKWNRQENRYETELFRTVGTAILVVGQYEIHVKNQYNDLSLDDLNYMLTDFKNSLWEVIIDNSNIVQANIHKKDTNKKNHSYTPQGSLQLLNELMVLSEKICRKPIVQLVEIQAKKNIVNLRAIKKTYIEIATKGPTKNIN